MLPVPWRLRLLDRALTTLPPTEGAAVIAVLLPLKYKFKCTDLQAVAGVHGDAIAGLAINRGQPARSVYDNELIALVPTDLGVLWSQVREHQIAARFRSDDEHPISGEQIFHRHVGFRYLL